MTSHISILNKVIRNLKTNYPVTIAIILFSSLVFPLCFYNNDYLNLVTSEHIDSGSTISSIFQMFDRTILYNQNIPYQTLYGYPYNSLLFFIFSSLKIIGFKVNTNFNYFILSARLLNYFISIFIIIEIYLLSKNILKHNYLTIIPVFFTIIFSPFLLYAYHLKPDLLGTLFIILSLKYLYLYLNYNKKTKNIIIANVFAFLSILCKQPNIFILVPLFIAYLFSFKPYFIGNLRNFIFTYIKSIVIFLPIFFLIHPYAFLDTNGFIAKQKLLIIGNASTPIFSNLKAWIPLYLNTPYLLLALLSPILYIIFFCFILNKKKKTISTTFLIYISIFSLIYQLWTITKVGPIRTDAYLLPVFSLSMLILTDNIRNIFIFLRKYYKFFGLFLISLLIIISLWKMFTNSLNIINYSIKYKSLPPYKSVLQLSSLDSVTFPKKSLIYSATIPIQTAMFKNPQNDWQFGDSENLIIAYQPDLILIDFTAWWEKSYSYWNKIAKDNNLNGEIILATDKLTGKNIILFYK